MSDEKMRWMLYVRKSKIDWMQSLVKEYSTEGAKISGSYIVEEALDRAMNDPNFESSLASAQYRIKLQKINDQKAVLAQQEQDLKRIMGRTTKDKVSV